MKRSHGGNARQMRGLKARHPSLKISRIFKPQLILRLLFTTAFSCAWAAAQGAQQNDLLDLSLEQLSQIRITTATLTEKSLENVPASVTVYTRDQIRRLGVRRLEDLLNFVPGYQSYNSDTSGFVHTFSSRGRRVGTTGREVLVLLDGHRLNNNWSGSMIASTLAPSLENVERVEIIRGAGSAIYGSNAELGVINIITRNSNEIQVNAGNPEHQQVAAQWSGAGENSSLQMFARGTDDDGQSLHLFDPNSQRTVATRDPYREHEFYLRGELNEFDVATRWAEADGDDKYSFGYVSLPGEKAEEEVRDYYIDAGWHRTLNNGLKVTVRGFVGDSRYSAKVPLASVLYASTLFREREQGINVLIQQTDGESNWLAGAELRRPDVYEASTFVTNSSLHSRINLHGIDEGTNTISGLFGQYEYALSTDSSFIAGLREDHYSDWGTHLSPRLGWIHKVDGANTIKLLYSEAFRAPSAVETQATTDVFVSNPNLNPETAKTGELVWQHIAQLSYLSATLYSGEINGAITEDPLPSGARGFSNMHQSMSGLEIECLLRVSTDWTLRTALTHQFDQASDINSESSNLLSGAFTYSLKKWTGMIGAYYAGERRDAMDTDRNASTVEYHLLGGHSVTMANVSWSALPQMELYLHADNLFDRHYFNPANRFQNTVGALDRGRELTLGVRWNIDK